MSARAIPNAVRYTLDKMAYYTMREARASLKDRFVLRNTWTSRSIAYEKVGPTNSIDRMESCTGSRMAYMRAQEEGIDRSAKGRHGEPIPTTEASGEGQTSVRKRRVLRRFYLGRLRVAKGVQATAKNILSGRGRSKKQTLAVMVRLANKLRQRVIFWTSPSGRRGLFRIDGKRLPMIYDLSETRIHSEARHWLTEPAVEVSEKRLYELYGKALRFQLYKLR